ncbi:MAG: BTAD domain-containing putative transcriptional regulator [Pedococcus sp.]
MLGPLRIDGAEGSPLPRKEAAVLAALVLRRGQWVSMETLEDALWQDSPPATAHAALQVYVSHLRKRLGASRLGTSPSGYRLVLGEDTVDADRFEGAVVAARAALVKQRPGTASRLLAAALSLWRGRPYPELDDWPDAEPAAAHGKELRSTAVELAAEAALALGRHAEAITLLNPMVDEFPDREPMHAALALALYRDGRQIEALDSLRRLRTHLQREFGVSTSAEIRDLETRILNQSPDLDPELAAAPRHAPPAPLTPTLGRERELAELGALVERGVRLVTLTGPGGIGKTRLAVEFARVVARDQDAPVHVVECASIADPDHVLPAVVQTLDDPAIRHENHRDALPRYFRSGGLLVLDNLEQVIDVGADVAALLRAAPELVIVATSRRPLRLTAEQVYPVPPLGLPTEGPAEPAPEAAPAVALFLARAASAAGREWADPDRAAAVEIVKLVDGLPLAIELAAARCRTLSPASLASRLRTSLALLSSGPKDLPERQRSISATVAWSIDQLSPAHRRLLGALAVWTGPVTLSAAAAVAGTDDELTLLEGLDELVEASLVRALDDWHGEPRFALLTVIREAASDLLHDEPPRAEAIAARNAWVVDLVSQAEPHLRGASGGEWLDRLEHHLSDIREALRDLSAAGQWDDAADVYCRLRFFWLNRVHFLEGALTGERLIEGRSLGTPHLGRVLRAAAVTRERCGEYEVALRHASAAVLVGRETGDAETEARGLASMASSTLYAGDVQGAERHWEATLEVSRRAGLVELEALTLGNMGLVALERHDFARAEEVYLVAAQRLRDLQLEDAVTSARLNIAWAQLGQGRLGAAAASLSEGLDRSVEGGSAEDLSYLALGIAALAQQSGQLGQARFLASGAHEQLSRCDAVLEPFEGAVHAALLEGAAAGLDHAAAQQLQEEAEAWARTASIEDVVAASYDALQKWRAHATLQGPGLFGR